MADDLTITPSRTRCEAFDPETHFSTAEPPADYVAVDADRPLWVFGYGSLMWDPGFQVVDRRSALLHGYHRRFCVYSYHYRGTETRPGLVLGLDRGGSCRGMAFEVAATHVADTLGYLWRREMISHVYRPTLLPVRLADRRQVKALCFVVDRRHEQYYPDTDPNRAAGMICRSHGRRGPNSEYLFNTVAHLDELGIADGPIHDLADRVRRDLQS